MYVCRMCIYILYVSCVGGFTNQVYQPDTIPGGGCSGIFARAAQVPTKARARTLFVLGVPGYPCIVPGMAIPSGKLR